MASGYSLVVSENFRGLVRKPKLVVQLAATRAIKLESSGCGGVVFALSDGIKPVTFVF